MTELVRASQIGSPQLREEWNQLCTASPGYIPTQRWETLQNYIQTFEPRSSMEMGLVYQDQSLVAGLPIIYKRSYGCLRVGQLPLNPWAECGTLVFSAGITDEVWSRLARFVATSKCHLFDFQWVKDLSGSWTRFRKVLEREGCLVHEEPQFEVGVVQLGDDWAAYRATLSKNFRKDLNRSQKRLAEMGEVQFVRHRQFDGEPLRDHLRTAFEIEHRGWKGERGSSAMSSPGIFDFYCRNAECLSRTGEFELHFLLVDGQPIAFDYGYTAAGTYYSHKVSFDPEYRKLGPGQLLMYLQLQAFCEDPGIERVDTIGILSEATARWCNDSYWRKRIFVTTASVLSRMALRGLLTARRLRRPDQTAPQSKLRRVPAKRERVTS